MDMAQLVKCLPYKHKELHLDLNNHRKAEYKSMCLQPRHLCRQRALPEVLWPTSLVKLIISRFIVRPCLKK